MATSRDVREIISKLSSDKSKARDEGIRLLNSWLEGERSLSLCRLLAKKTAMSGADGVPHEESWPFLLTLLTKCVMLEISTCKKRQPKLILAKTLRIAIQCAEDPKLSGLHLPLGSLIKPLFNHIWDVAKEVSLFHLEYSSILRHLLSVNEYRYQMRSRIYCNLLLLYLDKVVLAVNMPGFVLSSSKEEAFRCALTLHVLLENPPCDFPENIRENIVAGFIKIFSAIRDDGKYSRKLMECINLYLVKDGPNLGDLAANIHFSLQEFFSRFWLTTHDRGLKTCFILYASIQLKLSRNSLKEMELVEQLLDLISKELDQCTAITHGLPWNDASRDDKMGHLGNNYLGLMELAATIFYRSCKETRKVYHQEKRLKIVDAMDRIKDGILKGSWLWNGAFYFLTHTYGHCLDKSLLVYWLEGASESLKRLLNNPNTVHSYDALVWLLRAMQELSTLLFLNFEHSKAPLMSMEKVLSISRSNWNTIWTDLMHGLPAFGNVSPVVDAALSVLGSITLQEQVGGALVPPNMWDLRLFKYMPSPSALYFIACYFSTKGAQGDLRDVFHLRKNLLRASLDLVNLKEPGFLNDQTVLLIPAVSYSLASGNSHLLSFYKEPNLADYQNVNAKLSSMEGSFDHAVSDAEVLDCSIETLSLLHNPNIIERKARSYPSIRIPRQIREPLLHEMEQYISGLMCSYSDFEKIAMKDLINLCCLFCNFAHCSLLSRLRDENGDFSSKLLNYIVSLIDHIAYLVDENCHEIQQHGSVSSDSIFDASGSIFSLIESLISCPAFNLFKGRNIDFELRGVIQSAEKFLMPLKRSFSLFSNAAFSSSSGLNLNSLQFTGPQESDSAIISASRIIDMDLDAEDGSRETDSMNSLRSNTSALHFNFLQHKLAVVSLISAFSSVSPILAWETLFDLLGQEKNAKVSYFAIFT